MLLVAISGKKKSGKTRLAEALATILSRKTTVVYIKHIHHAGEPLDKEGSDTYRLTKAGAKAVAGVSPDAIFIRAKMDREDFDFTLGLLEAICSECDIAIVEGFHAMLSDRKDILRIYVAKNYEEALSIAETPPSPSFIYCESCSSEEVFGIRIIKEAGKLAEIIEEMLSRNTEES